VSEVLGSIPSIEKKKKKKVEQRLPGTRRSWCFLGSEDERECDGRRQHKIIFLMSLSCDFNNG
jgi:hypothetical protein